MNKINQLKLFAWSLSATAAIIAFVGWGQGVRWQLGHIDSYQLFPLFGLLAFSVMWSHYIVSAVRQYLGIAKKELHSYIEVTGWVVLAAILMHPGLLEWQLWRDGFGLPPNNVLESYVAPTLRWAALLGMVSLLIFLAYELRRWFSERGWWRAIEIATDAAMIAIYLHALNLGTQLQHGWLRVVWYIYGLTLLLALGYIYYRRYRPPKN